MGLGGFGIDLVDVGVLPAVGVVAELATAERVILLADDVRARDTM
jgi:hypothetical protein